MASSSTTPPYTGQWQHEVFLCFRGDDVRDNFMSHLERALKSRNIDYFIDTKLNPTQDNEELLGILERTAVSVVIFSVKFADSSWCLDEVCTIAESIEKYRHRVLPVFYNVDWNTVIGGGNYHWFNDWKSSFLSCFVPQPTPYAKTIAGLEATQERKKKWIASLKTVASKTGCTSESIPIDAELVEKVVADVIATLASMSPSIEYKNLVGMDTRVSKVEELLAMDDGDTSLIVGLWGLGGLGKSTLARTCYEKLRKPNEKKMKFHFVEKINETCDKSSPVKLLVKELYSTLLNEEPVKSGVEIRGERLPRLKVFVVLDDVQSIPQLNELLLEKALKLTELFAPGSRIIITTRNKAVLEYATAKMYEVDHLNDGESLELFKLNAFEDPGHIRHVELSRKVVTYCQGNPLALKVLGATLLRKDEPYWESFLGKLGEIQDQTIHSVLRRSYDELGNDDKRLFLDISCFFYGTVRSLLVKYMDSIYITSYHRVEDLIHKSLLMTTDDKIHGAKVTVHSLLREMAWNVVNEEEIIGDRSRLKNHDDIRILLSQEGKRATQGICLDLSKADVMFLKADAFKGMDCLKWLDFGWPNSVEYANRKIQLSDGDINYLPNELRGLNWDHFPCHSLPLGFSPRKLVYLVIRHSPIGFCWERNQPKLEHLMLLCLSNCENLAIVPDLSFCSNLEHILLRGCSTLVALPASIQFLEKLVTLDARDCRNLQLVPLEINSKFLKQLLLSNCPKLTGCPKVYSLELQALDLDGTPIGSLPDSINKVKQDGVVSLYGPCIAHFPQIPTGLSLLLLRKTAIQEIKIELQPQQQLKFDRLHLIWNAQLTTLPTEIWDMVSNELIVEDCPLIECLPVISEPRSYSLTTLHIAGCKKIAEFPASICKLECLEVLVFVGTDIESLPTSIGELKQLSYLDLSYSTRLKSVPGTISELGKLSELVLIGCGSSLSLPELLPPNLNVVKEKKYHRTSTLQTLLRIIIVDQKSNDLMLDFRALLAGSSVVSTKLPLQNMSRCPFEAGASSFCHRSVITRVAKLRQKELRADEATGGPMRRQKRERQSRDQNQDRVFTVPTQQLDAYDRPLPDHRNSVEDQSLLSALNPEIHKALNRSIKRASVLKKMPILTTLSKNGGYQAPYTILQIKTAGKKVHQPAILDLIENRISFLPNNSNC